MIVHAPQELPKSLFNLANRHPNLFCITSFRLTLLQSALQTQSQDTLVLAGYS